MKINRRQISTWNDPHVVREVPVKMRHHHTSVRMAKIRDTDSTKCWRGRGDRTSHSLLVGMQNGTATLSSYSTVVPYKINILLPYDPAIPLFGINPNELNVCPHKNLYVNVYSSFLIVIKTWKQSRCPSVGEWINKRWSIQTVEFYSAIYIYKKRAIKPPKDREEGTLNAYG